MGHGGVAEQVYLTGHAARMDHGEISGPAADRAKEMGIGAAVGVPIVVHGRIWGAAVVGSSGDEPLPADTEADVEDFTDLVATAISNAQARSELAASRARIVTAADSARRRLERDLHDGAQQRLLSLGLELRTAEASLRPDSDDVADQLSEIVTGLTGVSEELREISRGIHPAILSKGGLGPALKAVARRSAVPVELDISVDGRLPESVEVAAYFVVAESLTNVARYAEATEVRVSAETDDAGLRLTIRDDGVGGADPSKGSGLSGSSTGSRRSVDISNCPAPPVKEPRCRCRSRSRRPFTADPRSRRVPQAPRPWWDGRAPRREASCTAAPPSSRPGRLRPPHPPAHRTS